MGHHHHSPEKRLGLAILLNFIIFAVELAGGLISGSIALISDSLHNLSDMTALIISGIARRVSRIPSSPRMTYGYQRAEIIAALINLVLLLGAAGFLLAEGIDRLQHPVVVNSGLMIGIAVIGLLANTGAVLLLQRDAAHDLNIRAAFLHLLSDVLSSLGVVVGGLIIRATGFYAIDSIICFLIAGYICYASVRILLESLNILMEGAPAGIDIAAIKTLLEQPTLVREAYHLHLWRLSSRKTAFSADLQLADVPLSIIEKELRTVRESIRALGVEHISLQYTTRRPAAGGSFCQGGR